MSKHQTISTTAANQISNLLIEREHKVRLAKIWETAKPKDESDENKLWLFQCKAELEALEIEKTLRDELGIKLRDDWSSVTLEEEIKILTRCVTTAERSRAAA